MKGKLTMNALHLSTTQYFALAGLFALAGVALRGLGGTALTKMAERLKAHWKLIGIETNSYRTRGGGYTLYERREMKAMYDRIFNTSILWTIAGVVGTIVAIIVECLFILPASFLLVLSIITAWLAEGFFLIVLANYVTVGIYIWMTRYQLYREYPNIKF